MEWYKMLRTFTGSIIAPYYTYKYNRTVLVLLRSLYCRQAANYFLYLKLFFLFPFCLYFWMRQSHFTLEFFVCVLFLFIQCLSIFQTQPCINAQVYVDFHALLQFYCFCYNNGLGNRCNVDETETFTNSLPHFLCVFHNFRYDELM